MAISIDTSLWSEQDMMRKSREKQGWILDQIQRLRPTGPEAPQEMQQSPGLGMVTAGDIEGAAMQARAQGIADSAEMEAHRAWSEEVSRTQMQAQAEPQRYFGQRTDGTEKAEGFFGMLPYKGKDAKPGTRSSELSISAGVGGKETLMPSIVPSLSKAELDHVLSGKYNPRSRTGMDDVISRKAMSHAGDRLAAGKSPFADLGEQQPPPTGDSAVRSPDTAHDHKTFSSAFGDARASGLKEFTWRGQRFTTRLRGEKPQPKSKVSKSGMKYSTELGSQ